MGEAFINQKKSSGIKLNDIIEDFKYVYKNQKIKAGDFVNYINGVASKTDYGTSSNVKLNSNTYTGYSISAVALDNNRIFVAHSYGSTYYLYGVVCTINGATITCGSDTVLVSTDQAGLSISTLLISDNKVFIAHSKTSSYHLYGLICNISGTTIAVGTDTSIANYSGYYNISANIISDGRIFITSCYDSSNRYLYGSLITVSDNSITTNATKTISSTQYSGSGTSAVALSENRVLATRSNSNNYLYAIIITISSNTISYGTTTSLNTTDSYTGAVTKPVALLDNKVFIPHSKQTSWYYHALNGIVVSVSGTTITAGTDTVLSSVVWSGTTIDAIKISDNKVLIIHPYEDDLYLYSMIVTIDGLNVIAGTDVLLNSSVKSTGKLISVVPIQWFYSIFHSNSNDYYLHAQNWSLNDNATILTNNMSMVEYEQQVTPATSLPFDAVALSSGVGAPMVEQEVAKTGNIFAKTWTEISGTECVSNDGIKITANNYTEGHTVYKAFDNDTSTYWSVEGADTWIKIEFVNLLKITKMKIRNTGYSQSDITYTKIQGSNNNVQWEDLHTISGDVDELTEFQLANTDFYKYYKILIHRDSNYGNTAFAYEFQTSEYIVKEQVPSTEHNDQVKIARVYKEIAYEVETTKAGNAFPTSGWTEITPKLQYRSDNGYIITASSADHDYANNAFDNSTSTYWETYRQTDVSLLIECPVAIKVTKMKSYIKATLANSITNIAIQGSKDLNSWVTLYSPSTSGQSSLTSFTLSNPDYYKYYKIQATLTNTSQALYVYEWQTSEYIIKEKVTEVIQ